MITVLEPQVSAFIESGVIMVAEVVGHNAPADTGTRVDTDHVALLLTNGVAKRRLIRSDLNAAALIVVRTLPTAVLQSSTQYRLN